MCIMNNAQGLWRLLKSKFDDHENILWKIYLRKHNLLIQLSLRDKLRPIIKLLVRNMY